MTLAAVAANNTSAAWFTLVGALGGVLLTGALTLITAILNHRWKGEEEQETFAQELTKDLRTKRQSIYQEYWASFATFNSKLDALRQTLVERELPDNDVVKVAQEGEQSAFGDWWKNRITVMLIGGDDVKKALDKHLHAINSLRRTVCEEPDTVLSVKEVDQAADELFNAMHEEIVSIRKL